MARIHIKSDGSFRAVAAAHPNAARIKELNTQLKQAKKDKRISDQIESIRAIQAKARGKLEELRTAGDKTSTLVARARLVKQRDAAKTKLETLKGQLSNPRYANSNNMSRHLNKVIDQLATAKVPRNSPAANKAAARKSPATREPTADKIVTKGPVGVTQVEANALTNKFKPENKALAEAVGRRVAQKLSPKVAAQVLDAARWMDGYKEAIDQTHNPRDLKRHKDSHHEHYLKVEKVVSKSTGLDRISHDAMGHILNGITGPRKNKSDASHPRRTEDGWV